MKLPKIRKAQILSVIGFAADECVAVGVLSPSREQLIVQVAGIVLPGVLMIADAVIHHGWARVRVAEIEAEAGKVIALIEHGHSHADAQAQVAAK